MPTQPSVSAKASRWITAAQHAQLMALMADDAVSYFPITTETQVTVPSNRGRSKIGVAERVKCSVNAGVGPVIWSIVSGGGSLSTGGSPELHTVFTAPNTPPPDLKCVIKAIAADGRQGIKTLFVVQPWGVYMEAIGNAVHVIPPYSPTSPYASIYLEADVYFMASDVSFVNIEVMEDMCLSKATGWLAPWNNTFHPATVSWVSIVTGTDTSGSKLSVPDTLRLGNNSLFNPPPAFAIGDFTWNIPWLYRAKGTFGSGNLITKVAQVFTIDSSGGMTVSKAGATGATTY